MKISYRDMVALLEKRVTAQQLVDNYAAKLGHGPVHQLDPSSYKGSPPRDEKINRGPAWDQRKALSKSWKRRTSLLKCANCENRDTYKHLVTEEVWCMTCGFRYDVYGRVLTPEGKVRV